MAATLLRPDIMLPVLVTLVRPLAPLELINRAPHRRVARLQVLGTTYLLLHLPLKLHVPTEPHKPQGTLTQETVALQTPALSPSHLVTLVIYQTAAFAQLHIKKRLPTEPGVALPVELVVARARLLLPPGASPQPIMKPPPPLPLDILQATRSVAGEHVTKRADLETDTDPSPQILGEKAPPITKLLPTVARPATTDHALALALTGVTTNMELV